MGRKLLIGLLVLLLVGFGLCTVQTSLLALMAMTTDPRGSLMLVGLAALLGWISWLCLRAISSLSKKPVQPPGPQDPAP